MFGPTIENHEPISYMSLGYAVEVVERVHKYCFITICGKKRQAVALINEAARRAGAVAL